MKRTLNNGLKGRAHRKVMQKAKLASSVKPIQSVTKRRWQVTYKNGARMKVTVQNPPKNWRKIEPNDIIRISFANKDDGMAIPEIMIMRPDEAQALIMLLSNAIYYINNA